MKLRIDRLGFNGEGIGKIPYGEYENKLCFVPFSLPGEVVDVEIEEDKKRFCNAKLLNVELSSNSRINPKCPYFAICGACDLQHMSKDCQVDFKQNLVKTTLEKELKSNLDVENLKSLNDFYYRNKMIFPMGYDGKIGCFKKGTHDVVEIDKCLIVDDNINKVLEISKDFFSHSNFKGYDFVSEKGDVKYLCVRVGINQILVTVVAKNLLDLQDYYNELVSKLSHDIGISLIISDGDNEILSGKYIHLFGIEKLRLEECGIEYLVDNRGFLQVNNDIKNFMYNEVLKYIKNTDIVVDAYSGAGLLSSILAKKCRGVIGIEINQSASSSAKELAIKNKIQNIDFVCGDVKKHLRQCLNLSNANVVVLDPPRSGCDKEVLKIIIDANYQENKKSKIDEIIYISCNPATLARDLSYLNNYFQIEKIIPMDMFPQTKHVETLVCLQRRELNCK